MIRHMLLFSIAEDIDERSRQDLLQDMRDFPRWFPEIRDFEFGGSESDRDATYQYGMTMSFESFEELDSYLKSDRHEHFVRSRFRPLISRRAIVSFRT